MYPENTHRLGLLDSDDWAAFLPGSQGIIGLSEDGRPLTISMFHQLECLDIVRKQLVSRGENHSSEALPGQVCSGSHQSGWELTQHCMNYLRQMVLCHSHTALESIKSPAGSIDYTKSRYLCRDWTAVFDKWSHLRDAGL